MTTKNEFMTANINPEDVSRIIRECGQTIVLPYHGNLEEGDIDYKGGNPHNRVTVADHASERFLTQMLTDLLPGSLVVGEEAVEDDESILDLLDDDNNTVWVIDPIDGTGNFTRGSTTFCMIVALVSGGETKMSWIYDVCNDSMAFAQKGQGAFIDGQKIAIDQEAEPENATGYIGTRFKNQVQNIDIKTLKCSGLEYFRMAKGEALFSLYSMMKPWDHLAGTLLVQEAGGVVRKWDHSEYKPGDNKGGLITAANEEIWQKARQAIPEQSLRRQGIEP